VGSTIIFVHTRKTAHEVYTKMKAEGHQVSLLHGGDMEPAERDKVLDDFRSNKTRILITTNVLARGIDILQISLVINYDLPLDANSKPEPETYLHRIGRSGRFGRAGIAINFVDDDKSKRDLKYIEKHFQKDCKPFKEEDLEQLGKMLQAIN
jgi:ATP-dependent RNA helicase DDX19/DBP5